MITETNFTMLKKLKDWKPEKRDIISTGELFYIQETLHLKEFADVISLRNLRDFAFLFFSKNKNNFDPKAEGGSTTRKSLGRKHYD